MSLDFGYGLKKSGSIEEATKKSIEVVERLKIYKRNAFGTFLEVSMGKCNLSFKASTLGSAGLEYYLKGDMLGLAQKTFNDHFRGERAGVINLLVNHIMIEKENNAYRDLIVNELKNLGAQYNCAVPSGETAIMNNLGGIYLGLTSISIKEGNEYELSNKLLIPHADGVGTKVLIYKEGDYGFVIDGLAMNLNDLLAAALSTPEEAFACNTLIAGKGYESHITNIKDALKERMQKKRDRISC